jgi:hypothetical protein
MAKKNSKKETTEEVVKTEEVVVTTPEATEAVPVEPTESLCDLPADEQPEVEAVPGTDPDAVVEGNTEEVATEEEPCKLKLDKGVEPFEKKIRDTVYIGFEFGGEVRYVPSQHCSYDKKAHCIVIPAAIFDSLKFKIEK